MHIIKLMMLGLGFFAACRANVDELLVKKAHVYLERKTRNRYFKNLVYPGDFPPKVVISAEHYLEIKRESFLNAYEHARAHAFKNGIIELGASLFLTAFHCIIYLKIKNRLHVFLSL